MNARGRALSAKPVPPVPVSLSTTEVDNLKRLFALHDAIAMHDAKWNVLSGQCSDASRSGGHSRRLINTHGREVQPFLACPSHATRQDSQWTFLPGFEAG